MTLSLDSLRLERRGLCLLDRASVVVEPGETLAVMGPSGAGKTTLLRTLAGHAPPSAGTVVRPPGPVAMVFQEPRLLPWRTALANVELVLAPEQRHRAGEWLERVGLADTAHLFPAALSGGMRQRVSIARALAFDSAAVLVDEPFSNLDAATARRLRDLLTEQLRTLDRVVVWVTHDAVEAEEVARRTLVMEGPPSGAWRLRDRAPTTPSAAVARSDPPSPDLQIVSPR